MKKLIRKTISLFTRDKRISDGKVVKVDHSDCFSFFRKLCMEKFKIDIETLEVFEDDDYTTTLEKLYNNITLIVLLNDEIENDNSLNAMIFYITLTNTVIDYILKALHKLTRDLFYPDFLNLIKSKNVNIEENELSKLIAIHTHYLELYLSYYKVMHIDTQVSPYDKRTEICSIR